MAAKEIGIRIRAKWLGRAAVSKAKKALRSVGRVAMLAGVAVKKAAAVIKKAALVMSAAIVAGAGLAVKAFAKQEAADRKLADSMEGVGAAAEELMPKLKALASTIQDETGKADEDVQGLMATLINLGVAPKSMEAAARGAIGLAEALNLDAESAARYSALALQGEFTILQRYVPALRTATTEAEKQAIVMDLMSRGYKQAQGQLDTTAGRIKEFKGRLGDALEVIGKAITGGDSMADSFARMSEKIKELTANGTLKKWAEDTIAAMRGVAAAASAFFTGASGGIGHTGERFEAAKSAFELEQHRARRRNAQRTGGGEEPSTAPAPAALVAAVEEARGKIPAEKAAEKLRKQRAEDLKQEIALREKGGEAAKQAANDEIQGLRRLLAEGKKHQDQLERLAAMGLDEFTDHQKQEKEKENDAKKQAEDLLKLREKAGKRGLKLSRKDREALAAADAHEMAKARAKAGARLRQAQQDAIDKAQADIAKHTKATAEAVAQLDKKMKALVTAKDS